MDVGNSLYISASVQPRQYNASQLDLRIESVDFLANVKDKLVHDLTISFWLEDLNEDTVFTLANFAKENPGKVQLNFQIRETNKNINLQVTSLKHKISVSKELIDYLDKQDSLTYKIS